jgi:hypothetical protein
MAEQFVEAAITKAVEARMLRKKYISRSEAGEILEGEAPEQAGLLFKQGDGRSLLIPRLDDAQLSILVTSVLAETDDEVLFRNLNLIGDVNTLLNNMIAVGGYERFAMYDREMDLHGKVSHDVDDRRPLHGSRIGSNEPQVDLCADGLLRARYTRRPRRGNMSTTANQSASANQAPTTNQPTSTSQPSNQDAA